MNPKPISDRDVYRISSLYNPPEFVKAASSDDILGDDNDQPIYFADPQYKAYSTRTKAATWISVAHFLEKAAAYPETRRILIGARLDEAVRYFGLQDDVRQLRAQFTKVSSVSDATLDDSKFGWIKQGEPRRLRLLNADEVSKAASWLIQNRDIFTFPDRMKIAKRIVSRAQETGARIQTDTLDKIAGYGSCNTQTVIDALMTRVGLLRRQKAADAIKSLTNLAETISDNPSALIASNRRVKLAALLDQLDRAHGLQVAYERDGLARPEESLFRITEKTAKDFLSQYAHSKTGDVYLCADLDKVAATDFCELVGNDLTEVCTSDGVLLDGQKVASVLPTLTDQNALSVSAALNHLGVSVAAYAPPDDHRRLDLVRLAASARP